MNSHDEIKQPMSGSLTPLPIPETIATGTIYPAQEQVFPQKSTIDYTTAMMVVAVLVIAMIWSLLMAVCGYHIGTYRAKLAHARNELRAATTPPPVEEVPDDYTLADRIGNRVNAEYYKVLLSAFLQSFMDQGYRLTHRGERPTPVLIFSLKTEEIDIAAEALCTARRKYLNPNVYKSEIADLVRSDIADGYARTYAQEILDALSSEGRYFTKIDGFSPAITDEAFPFSNGEAFPLSNSYNQDDNALESVLQNFRTEVNGEAKQ